MDLIQFGYSAKIFTIFVGKKSLQSGMKSC